MKLLILSLLLSLSFAGSAQYSIKSIDIQTGATLMDWDGAFRSRPNNFTHREGYFLGIGISLQRENKWEDGLYSSLSYRKTHTYYKWNVERIKLDEIAWSLGVAHKWKKLTFGLNGSLVYVLAKEKLDNTLITGLDIEDVENFYLSFSGRISFSLLPRASLFIEQALLNTKVHSDFSPELGQLFEVPYYPGWTLLGLSYSISKRE